MRLEARWDTAYIAFAGPTILGFVCAAAFVLRRRNAITTRLQVSDGYYDEEGAFVPLPTPTRAERLRRERVVRAQQAQLRDAVFIFAPYVLAHLFVNVFVLVHVCSWHPASRLFLSGYPPQMVSSRYVKFMQLLMICFANPLNRICPRTILSQPSNTD